MTGLRVVTSETADEEFDPVVTPVTVVVVPLSRDEPILGSLFYQNIEEDCQYVPTRIADTNVNQGKGYSPSLAKCDKLNLQCQPYRGAAAAALEVYIVVLKIIVFSA